MQVIHLAVHGCKTVFTEKYRSLWVVLGIALGIGLYVTITILSNGYSRLVTLPFEQLNTDLIIQRAVQGAEGRADLSTGGLRLPFSNQPLSRAEIERLQGLESVETINRAVMLWFQNRKDFSVIAGVDIRESLHDSGGPVRVMSWIDKGRRLERSGEMVVESHYAKFHKIKLGKEISFNNHSFTVVGIAKIRQGASVAAANYYIGIDDARIMADMEPGSGNMLFVRLRKGADVEEVRKQLQTILPGAIASTADNITSMLKGFAGISQRVSRILGIAALVFAALLGGWLIAGILQERTNRIGLMKTIGWQRRDILTAIAAETFLLGCIGAVCGVGLGYLAAMLVGLQEVSLTVPWNLAVQAGPMKHGAAGAGTQVVLPVVIGIKTWMIALGIGCFSAMVSGLVIGGKLAGSRVKAVFANL